MLRLLAPLDGKLVRDKLRVVDGPLLLADQQHARVGDGLVQPLAQLLVHQHVLRLLEPVKGVGRLRVGRLVRMDQQRDAPVLRFDVGFGHAGLEVEDGIAVVGPGVGGFVSFSLW